MNKTLCPYPWMGLSVTGNDISFCCDMLSIPNLKGSLKEVVPDEILTNYRKKFLTGDKTQLPECKSCWEKEDSGVDSRRLRGLRGLKGKGFNHFGNTIDTQFDVLWKNDKVNIKHIAFRVLESTQCNAACNICFPALSSTLTELSKQKTPELYQLGRFSGESLTFTYDKEKFKNDIRHFGPDLEYVTISGGEPFLNNSTKDFMEAYFEANSKAIVTLITNGSKNPRTFFGDTLFEKIVDSNRIDLSISADDINHRYNWLRYPLQFNHLINNIESNSQFKTKVNINPTWSFMNISNIYNIVDYFATIGITVNFTSILSHPAQYSFRLLPNQMKENVIQQIEKLIKFNRSPALQVLKQSIENSLDYENPNLFAQGINEIHIFNKMRKTNFFDVFNEFKQMA